MSTERCWTRSPMPWGWAKPPACTCTTWRTPVSAAETAGVSRCVSAELRLLDTLEPGQRDTRT
ncbi:hypothetical protein JOF56_004838 [Kibdelosporangium banguiense]|uniref:Uncharacterized protein n=1 Tax=Kibdelosporangium banguiense TaxID=1365924 RepID=A0ABS4TJ46_9PSEU|nr:hypothetical protein [Kibdelosporangium banguiense]MBP2324453.1 hypothetical protein [Kibdelosporangium banguiense]